MKQKTTMWHRLTTGWTFIRGIYLLLGIFVIVQSVQERFWAGVAFGAYFSAMGLFAFGCAGGHCATPSQTNTHKTLEKIEFEEVK